MQCHVATGLSHASTRCAPVTHVAHAHVQGSGAEGFILDLRNNPGGLVRSGLDIARLWMDGDAAIFNVQGREDNGHIAIMQVHVRHSICPVLAESSLELSGGNTGHVGAVPCVQAQMFCCTARAHGAAAVRVLHGRDGRVLRRCCCPHQLTTGGLGQCRHLLNMLLSFCRHMSHW